MPKSRKRKKKVGRTNQSDSLALESMFDGVGPPSTSGPRILHHYTAWNGAAGILSSQQFWATAHSCTNDPAELRSADDIIIEVAKELRSSAVGTAFKTLSSFISQYSKVRISEVLTVCLTCFSLARDDEEQWRRYGDNGRGVCLSLRVVDETPPKGPRSKTVAVDYSESSWRDGVRADFIQYCDLLSRYEGTPENIRSGVLALNQRAAFQCLVAKKPEWSVEQEFRHVTLVPSKSGIQLKQRETPDGTKLCLPVLVRADGKRIALAEILIGPNRDAEETQRELTVLLSTCGYQVGSAEYPAISLSAIPPWCE